VLQALSVRHCITNKVSLEGKSLYADLIGFSTMLLGRILYFNEPFQDAEPCDGVKIILLNFTNTSTSHKF
jgi:hypothetical protein